MQLMPTQEETYYEAFDKNYVDYVDTLLRIAKHNESTLYVKSDKDWDTINFLYKGWRVFFPITSEDFEKQMTVHRSVSKLKGIAKEQGGAMIQHMIEVPRPLYDMIAAIFPMQKWDKKFTAKFSDKLPQFKASDAKL